MEYVQAMLRNRSVPVDTLLPHIAYKRLPEAIDWLSAVFGFVELYRYGEPISGAQVRLANAFLMVNAKPEQMSPAEFGYGTQSLTIFVEDVEAHFARSKAVGAKVVEELHETEYGELQYGVLDLEGHHWLFSRHAHDISPDTWGATIKLRSDGNNPRQAVGTIVSG
jgi:uncharacterized glyoxalase superfamily protein PhnB